MKFNRERFLLFMLAGLLLWQAVIFTYGMWICSTKTPLDFPNVCPEIGRRFDKFVQTTLGAVLGLLAGAAGVSVIQAKGSSSSGDPSSLPASPPLPPDQRPSVKGKVRQPQDQGKDQA